MTPSERVSNAEDYEVTAGRLCPFCGNTDKSLIEPIRAGFACVVCGKIWAAIPEKYRGDWRP
jgi:hypothetical protein